MTSSDTFPRVLWNSREAIVVFAVGLGVTCSIVGAQIGDRGQIFDPSSIGIFQRLFLFHDYPGSLVFLLALVCALLPATQTLASKLVSGMARHVVSTSCVAAALLAGGAMLFYRGHPLAMDEYAAYLQSQAFAAGRLRGQWPVEMLDWLIFPQFQNFFIYISRGTGEIASSYWPGFAILLTPFTALGLPWLCNPVLGAGALLVIFRLTRTLTSSIDAAGAALLFTIGSAAFVINAFSFYSMNAHLLCNALFALLVVNPTPMRAALAGSIGGLALTLHNPLPHALFAVPWIIWLLTRGDRWRLAAALAIGYLPWIVFVGFGWHYMLQGVRDTFLGADQVSTTPWGAVLGLLKQVVAAPGSEVLSARTIALAKLWLWSAPAVVVLAAVGFWRWRRDVRFLLLFASLMLTFVGYLFIPVDQGHGWGFRYLHSTWFAIPIFAAALFARPVVSTGRPTPCIPNLHGFALGSALCGLLLMVPYYSLQVRDWMDSHLAQIPSTEEGEPRVVIINPFGGYYAQDLIQNDAFLRDTPTIMMSHGRAVDAQMMARHYSDLVLLAQDYRGSVWGYPIGPVATADDRKQVSGSPSAAGE